VSRRPARIDAIDLALDALEDARRREDQDASIAALRRECAPLWDLAEWERWELPEWFPAPMPEVGPVDQECK
jgi:hypothetical protein